MNKRNAFTSFVVPIISYSYSLVKSNKNDLIAFANV